MRKSTIAKFSDLKKTGAAGDNLSEIDNLILDIIGRDSAALNGHSNST